jgi:hypothetical protein
LAALPSKVAVVVTALVLHVRLCPVPQGVELRLPVELNGDHHAVAQSLGAHVPVAGVVHIGFRTVFVAPIHVVERRGRAPAKVVVPEDLYLSVHVRLARPEPLAEEIAVVAAFARPNAGRRRYYPLGFCLSRTRFRADAAGANKTETGKHQQGAESNKKRFHGHVLSPGISKTLGRINPAGLLVGL